jgi:hypothetical protein
MMKSMSLEKFLEDKVSIPVEEQIWLINNPKFYSHYFACLESRGVNLANGLLTRIIKRGMRIFKLDPDSPKFRLPKQSCVLWLGLPDKSFDGVSCLKVLYDEIRQNPEYSYTLLIGKGDYSLREKQLLNIPDNLRHIFANNVNIEHPKVSYFPMGRDFRSAYLFSTLSPTADKSYLCYCNFSVSTHPVREAIYESIKSREFMEFDHMGKFLSYSLTREEFYRKLGASKFALCPRGNGIDTFRMWDCLYCGTIPIVVREAVFHQELEDLPILFLDGPEDYAKLSEPYLEQKYLELTKKVYNYEKLLLSYWLKRIDATAPLLATA